VGNFDGFLLAQNEFIWYNPSKLHTYQLKPMNQFTG
jgi:hypothetical protein